MGLMRRSRLKSTAASAKRMTGPTKTTTTKDWAKGTSSGVLLVCIPISSAYPLRGQYRSAYMGLGGPIWQAYLGVIQAIPTCLCISA